MLLFLAHGKIEIAELINSLPTLQKTDIAKKEDIFKAFKTFDVNGDNTIRFVKMSRKING